MATAPIMSNATKSGSKQSLEDHSLEHSWFCHLQNILLGQIGKYAKPVTLQMLWNKLNNLGHVACSSEVRDSIWAWAFANEGQGC